jgi:nicotinamide riboside kinase
VNDGTRYFPSAENRARFAQLCREELDSRKLPYVVVSGTWDQRFSQALAAVQRVFGLDLNDDLHPQLREKR